MATHKLPGSHLSGMILLCNAFILCQFGSMEDYAWIKSPQFLALMEAILP